MTSFSLVAALDAQRGIGAQGDLPWRLPSDMAYFKKLTKETSNAGAYNAVVMGRKTWESIPARFRPLVGRLNVVLTRQHDYRVDEGVLIAHHLDDALKLLADDASVEHIYVVGGGAVYAEAIEHTDCASLYLTEIQETYPCDTFFPTVPSTFVLDTRSEVVSDNGVCFTYARYTSS